MEVLIVQRRINGKTRTRKRSPMPMRQSQRDFTRKSSVHRDNDFSRYVMRGGVRK